MPTHQLEHRTAGTNGTGDPMPHHETTHRYSLFRAVNLMLNEQRLNGLEGEVHDELAKRFDRQPKGILIPHDLVMPERRGLDTTSTGSAAANQTVMPRTLIDVLRSKLVVKALGGQVMDFAGGKPGRIQMPFKTAAASVSWVGEGASPTASTMSTVDHVLVPHCAAAWTDVTRRLLVYATPDLENWVLDDLATGIAHAIDTAAINGVGDGTIPLGLLQRALPLVGIASDSGDGGAATYDDVVALEKAVGVANGDASADAAMGFLTSPAGRSKLRRTDLGGATQTGRKLWCVDEGVEEVIGWPAAASTSVPANVTKGIGTALTLLAYGNWRDLIVNLFSGIDLLVDPFKQSTLGVVRMTAFQDVDVAVLRVNSFAILNAMTT
jgi:HK97 family phage major capsid protein